MSDTAITLKWAGGEHRFNLATKWAIMLFEGVDQHAAVRRRFESDTYSATDVREVIRIGLIGGGTPIDEAERLVQRHVDGEPLAANAIIAYAVVTALFVGAEAGAEVANEAKAA